MLVPKFASEGYYVDEDRVDVLEHVQNFVSKRFPEQSVKAGEEMVQFVSKMSSLVGLRKENTFKMDARSYWNVLGRHEFPCLYLCAQSVNEMITTSAASERVSSVYRLIRSRSKTYMSKEKEEKLVFVYVNCAILDKNDQTDYIQDFGVFLSGLDFENEEES